jgi:ribosomal protein S18 acetylase RimI-like enzyme
MMAPVVIRPADPADYDRIIGRLDDWWGGRNMASMLPRLFFTHFRPWTYVAEQSDGLVAFLAAFRSQTDPDQVYCHFVGVSPEARGQRIGEALYHRLFADAALAGVHEILAVTSPANAASVAFHRRLGFEPLAGPMVSGETPYTPAYDGPGEDRVRFRKLLSGPTSSPATASR